MSIAKNEKGEGGLGVIGLLGVAFVVLKLMGVIDWAWIWVLAPFWVGIAIILVIGLFFVGYTVLKK